MSAAYSLADQLTKKFIVHTCNHQITRNQDGNKVITRIVGDPAISEAFIDLFYYTAPDNYCTTNVFHCALKQYSDSTQPFSDSLISLSSKSIDMQAIYRKNLTFQLECQPITSRLI